MTDLIIRTERDREILLNFVQTLDLAKPKKVAISEVRNKRSDAQNRLMWQWNGLIQAIYGVRHK